MKTIDLPVEVQTDEPTKAVQIRQHQEAGQALSASQITEKLRFIRQVMKENMTEGTDYGKVPGCGDKPGLFQPGAQKLSMTFQLNPEVREEVITDYPNLHRGYRFVVRVSNGNKFAEGVGECSTLESKYRFRSADRTCPHCHKPAIIIGKEEYGGGFLCYKKKGGCGSKFADNDPAIVSQPMGKVEHDNPPDHWNTTQKMGFKRAFVHAIINATNTSELWSQDLEDLASNGITKEEPRSSNTRNLTGGNHNLGASVAGLGPAQTARVGMTPMKQPDARTVSPSGVAATAKHRDRMLELLVPIHGQEGLLNYARAKSFILPSESGEGLGDIPLRYVPIDERQLNLMKADIELFYEGAGDDKPPFVNPEPDQDTGKSTSFVKREDPGVGGWRDALITFGKHKGKTLGQLERNSLAWYCRSIKASATYTNKTTRKEVQKSQQQMTQDIAFRKSLDAAMAELGITDGGEQ